jgi:DNA (cytosine-5)-methyltransferase 1
MTPLTSIDLFSGVGGFSLAADRLGIKTTQFVEIDPDAQTVLRAHYPNIPIHDDICTYHPSIDQADIFSIGFPCTGTSTAGTRTGLEHQESSLWFEALRCIAEGKPRFIVIENPEGLISRGLRAVLGGLRVCGYCWDDPQLISASELGACHQRKRLFIVAYPKQFAWAKQPCSWADQMRHSIETVRAKAQWLQFERRGDGCVARVPDRLGEFDLNVKNGTAGRIRSRFLFGRTVTPYQAQIPLMRVQYLNSLGES